MTKIKDKILIIFRIKNNFQFYKISKIYFIYVKPKTVLFWIYCLICCACIESIKLKGHIKEAHY